MILTGAKTDLNEIILQPSYNITTSSWTVKVADEVFAVQ